MAVDRLPAHGLLLALGEALERGEVVELVAGVAGAFVDVVAVRVAGELVTAIELPPGLEERAERKEYGARLVLWQISRNDYEHVRTLST
jgi:hypothetical protein